MKCYQCFFSNGAILTYDAYSADDAKRMAEEEAEQNGYAGLSVVRVECLDSN